MINRERLIKVFEDTKTLIKEKYQTAVKASIAGTELHKGIVIEPKAEKQFMLKNVSVNKKTTFEAAIDLNKRYPDKRIAVLNFASATNPGGGVKNGSSAQEECLCRASTLYPCLTTTELFEKFYKVNRESKNALHTDDVIYTPGVYVLKDDSNDYWSLRHPFMVDVLTCAAPNLREHTVNQYNPGEGAPISISDEDLYKLHLNRAKNIFEVAKEHDVKILVLGAFGCGAFKNNPKVVARAYRNALYEYAQYFDKVEFAIYCKSNGESANYDAFKNIED